MAVEADEAEGDEMAIPNAKEKIARLLHSMMEGELNFSRHLHSKLTYTVK